MLGLEKKLERRARILAAARRALAKYGLESLTISKIAKEAGVTVTTLYNMFGDKEKVVAAAVEERFLLQLGELKNKPDVRGLQKILELAHHVLPGMENEPEYVRALVHVSRASPVVSNIVHSYREIYRTGIEEMQQAGELLPWASSGDLAGIIAAHASGVNQLWSQGLLTVPEVKRRRSLAIYLLLASVAEPRMSDYLREQSRALCERREDAGAAAG